MAVFNFNISESTFSIEQYSAISTDCASQFVYKVNATLGDTIKFKLEGSSANPIMWISQSYEVDGVETFDWIDTDEKSVSFSKELYINFVLDNSGDPGRFNECKITVENTTTSATVYEEVVRENDELSCNESDDLLFDDLIDTPANKTGNSLNIVRVNLEEDALEYVDAGSLGSDLNYTWSQNSSSTSWTMNHNLGKFPSVTVQDDSGNAVHGDVTYTDVNNLSITFNTAFSGKAYLN